MLQSEPDSIPLQSATAEARLNLANVLYYNDRLAQVYPLVRSAIESLSNARQPENESAEVQALLGRAHTLHAMNLSWDGKQQEAEAEMGKAFAIGKALAVKYPNDNVVRQALLHTYTESAQLYEEVDSARSYELLQEALRLAEQSVAFDAGDLQARQTLAKTYSKLGVICVHLGKNDEAVAHLQKAAGMLADLQRLDSKSRAYRHDTARVLTSLGRAQHQQREFANALANYEKARAIFEEEARADASNIFAARKLATLHSNIADTYRDLAATSQDPDSQPHLREARQHYSAAVDVLLRLQAMNTLTEFDRQSIRQLQDAAAAIQTQ